VSVIHGMLSTACQLRLTHVLVLHLKWGWANFEFFFCLKLIFFMFSDCFDMFISEIIFF
jgi:hypothetical protein